MTAPPAAPLLTQDNEDLARDYDRISVDRQLQSGKSLLQRLAPASGEHVLDIGCGTGLLADYIAARTGLTGYVLGIDPLPLRIALAQTKTRPGLEFRVGDAYRLDVLRPTRSTSFLHERRLPLAAGENGPAASDRAAHPGNPPAGSASAPA